MARSVERAVCFWILYAVYHFPTYSAELLPEVCCLNSSDVVPHTVGGVNHILVVDGFFCDAFLGLALRVAGAANTLGMFSTRGAFPGSQFTWGDVSSDPAQVAALAKHAEIKEAAELKQLEVLLSGQYLECVKDFMESAGFGLQPDWSAAEISGQYDHMTELLARGRYSMVTQRPTRSNVHHDDGKVVINIHLSQDFEDTGTAFYETKNGLQACMGDAAALRDCMDATDAHGVFCTIQQKRLKDSGMLDSYDEQPCEDRHDDCGKRVEAGACTRNPISMYRDCTRSCGVCGGMWAGPHVPRGEDHSGIFKVHRIVPFKLNRLIVYNGGLFHSGFFAMESVPRLAVTAPGAGRLAIQHFLPEPQLILDNEHLASVDGVFAIIHRIKSKAPIGRVRRKTRRLLQEMAESGTIDNDLATAIKRLPRPMLSEL